MKRISLLLIIAGILAACTPTITSIKMRTARYERISPKNIKIYFNETDLKIEYKELGFIVANTHLGFPNMIGLDAALFIAMGARPFGNQTYSKELDKLLDKASSMGANAIVIKSIDRVASGISIAAVAIRTL